MAVNTQATPTPWAIQYYSIKKNYVVSWINGARSKQFTDDRRKSLQRRYISLGRKRILRSEQHGDPLHHQKPTAEAVKVWRPQGSKYILESKCYRCRFEVLHITYDWFVGYLEYFEWTLASTTQLISQCKLTAKPRPSQRKRDRHMSLASALLERRISRPIFAEMPSQFLLCLILRAKVNLKQIERNLKSKLIDLNS